MKVATNIVIMSSLSSTSSTSTNTLSNVNTFSRWSSSSSSSSSNSSTIDNGQSIPKARQYLNEKGVKFNDEEYPMILFTMATCLNDDEKYIDRIDKLVEKKAFAKNSIKPTKASYKNEIIRRFEIIEEYQESDGYLGGTNKKEKMPKFNHWDISKLIQWLKKHPLGKVDD